MMYGAKVSSVAIVLMAALFLFGCSGSAGMNPALPGSPGNEITGDEQVGTMRDLPVSSPGHKLAGIFNLEFDFANRQIKVVAMREASAHYDATGLLLPPNCNDCISIVWIDSDTAANVIEYYVFLKNPGPVTVFDVKGILMSNQEGWRILDCYGYTPLYDDGPPVLYNPYNEFRTSLSYSYKITPGEQCEARYYVQYPDNPDFGGLKYVVDVSWPDYCKEPYEFTIEGPGSMAAQPGDYSISADTKDHQKDETSVVIDGSPIGAGEIQLQAGSIWVSTRHWHGSFHFPGVEAGYPPGKYELLCRAYSSTALPVIQLLNVNISEYPMPKDVTPGYLNISPNSISRCDDLMIIGGSREIALFKMLSPTSPSFLGTVDFSGEGLRNLGMLVDDDVIIVRNDNNPGIPWNDNFGIVDISNPSEPALIDVINLPDGWENYFGFHLLDGFLILMQYKLGNDPYVIDKIRIYDVSPPSQSHMEMEIEYPSGFYPTASILEGDKLYLIGNSRMVIYSCEPAVGLVLLSDYAIPSLPDRISYALAKGYMYIGGFDGVHTFDVEPGEQAHYVGHFYDGVEAENLLALGDYLYISFYNYEPHIEYMGPVNIANPELPEVLAPVEGHLVEDVWAVEGNRIYAYLYDKAVTSMQTGVQVMDLTNPELPVFNVWHCGYSSLRKEGVLIDGNLYVLAYDLGVLSLDVSNPSSMNVSNTFFTICAPRAVEVVGSTGYILDADGWLKVVDISSPARCRVVDILPKPPCESPGCEGNADLDLWNDYLVALNFSYTNDDLRLYDISDPFHPQLVASQEGLGSGHLDMDGDLGIRTYPEIQPFVINSPQDIQIYDKIQKEYYEAAIHDSLVYAVTNYTFNPPPMPIIPELHVLDPLAAPGEQKLKGISLPGYLYSIAISGKYAYISDDLTGIDIVKIEPWNEMEFIDSCATAATPGRLIRKGPLIISLYGENTSGGWELFYRDLTGRLHSVFYTDSSITLPCDACIDNGSIYICDPYTGLHIYQAW